MVSNIAFLPWSMREMREHCALRLAVFGPNWCAGAAREREESKTKKRKYLFFWWGVLKGIKNFDDDDEDDAVVIGFPLSFLVFFFFFLLFFHLRGRERGGKVQDLILSIYIDIRQRWRVSLVFYLLLLLSANRSNPSAGTFFHFIFLGGKTGLRRTNQEEGKRHDS